MLLDEINLAAQGGEDHNDVNLASESIAVTATQPEARSFGLPAVIWTSMAISYVIFFGGLVLGAGHDGKAIFMIVISMLYAVMYFGTATALNTVGSARRKGLKSQWIEGKFQTLTGPMSFGAVYGQILTVPLMFAFFGVAIAIIRLVVM